MAQHGQQGGLPSGLLDFFQRSGQVDGGKLWVGLDHVNHGFFIARGLTLTDMVESLQEQGQAVNRGDLSIAERMLNSQTVALNAIFGEMARRAALNMGQHLGATETYLRLALKAQSQCRATLETLAVIKNPPMVFTKQMNVANGPQQVNNGPRTLEKQSTPNELLEDLNHGRTPLDTRTAPATSREDSRLEPVEAINRPAHA